MDVLLGSFQNFSEWLIFRNANGRVLPKIQTSFSLEPMNASEWMSRKL